MTALLPDSTEHWLTSDRIPFWRKPVRVLGLASLVVGVTAAGLILGRELRIRYKFKRRTPSDFFSAADAMPGAEYGMGV